MASTWWVKGQRIRGSPLLSPGVNWVSKVPPGEDLKPTRTQRERERIGQEREREREAHNKSKIFGLRINAKFDFWSTCDIVNLSNDVKQRQPVRNISLITKSDYVYVL